ncbi:MAG: DNA mismatch repair endonuclease MutL [Holosporales bacterium]|nr:DNA mismatch repair endonuclease MutL [Holosporales bacterium]
MVKKVAILRADVINQIAAGEVLENPASAVKELIENSMDAGATRICVEIKGGGHQLVRVEDNGMGMGREDALGCLERHATSKIRETDDLLALGTMGFRGEALAAIASVSRMEIETSDGEETTSVRVEAGRVVSVNPCARNRGTTIDMRDLFYNVPARQKFQKSAASSASQVFRVMQMAALAWPEIAFTLKTQERETLCVEGEEPWRVRVEKVLGPYAHEVKRGELGRRVYGLVGSPLEAKGNRSGQYVFVNRRPIFSPLISRAVKDAYATRVGEGKYPSFVLFLEMPGDEVDVNVHPQKRDVRFRDEGRVYRLVERAVSEAFGPVPGVHFSAPLAFQEQKLPWDIEPVQMSRPVEFMQIPLLQESKKRPIALIGSLAFLEGPPFVLLDLKGAEARLLFENMHIKSFELQTLLVPLEIILSAEEASQGEHWADELKKLGIEARFLGGKTLAIDALPVGLEVEEVSDFFSDWKQERKVAGAICRVCRARKKSYSLQEAALIEQKLMQCADKVYDPLGRIIRKEVKEEQFIQWLINA